MPNDLIVGHREVYVFQQLGHPIQLTTLREGDTGG